MDTAFVTAGIACLIAAVVGGGLKAFSIEIPALRSTQRQAGLGVLGLVLIGAGLVVSTIENNRPRADNNPPKVTVPPGTTATPGQTNDPPESPSKPTCTDNSTNRLDAKGQEQLTSEIMDIDLFDEPPNADDEKLIRELVCRPLIDKGYSAEAQNTRALASLINLAVSEGLAKGVKLVP